VAAISSPSNVVFIMARTALHPALVSSVCLNPWRDWDFSVQALAVYTACGFLIGGLANYLATRRPQGPQPATFGHLQTLADLVDDWNTDDNGHMWWGDKASSMEGGYRQAGTSCNTASLSTVDASKEYR
jgi:hypothetical protein